jgi:hypothetical protein
MKYLVALTQAEIGMLRAGLRSMGLEDVGRRLPSEATAMLAINKPVCDAGPQLCLALDTILDAAMVNSCQCPSEEHNKHNGFLGHDRCCWVHTHRKLSSPI